MDLGEGFKYREELMMIREAGKRAAAVVNDLLTVARGATCKKTVHNVNSIITDYLTSVEFKELNQRFPEVKITPYLEGKLQNVNCSSMHLCKSIMNSGQQCCRGHSGQRSGHSQHQKHHLDRTPIRGTKP